MVACSCDSSFALSISVVVECRVAQKPAVKSPTSGAPVAVLNMLFDYVIFHFIDPWICINRHRKYQLLYLYIFFARDLSIWLTRLWAHIVSKQSIKYMYIFLVCWHQKRVVVCANTRSSGVHIWSAVAVKKISGSSICLFQHFADMCLYKHTTQA